MKWIFRTKRNKFDVVNDFLNQFLILTIFEHELCGELVEVVLVEICELERLELTSELLCEVIVVALVLSGL